ITNFILPELVKEFLIYLFFTTYTNQTNVYINMIVFDEIVSEHLTESSLPDDKGLCKRSTRFFSTNLVIIFSLSSEITTRLSRPLLILEDTLSFCLSFCPNLLVFPDRIKE
ncbi:504_t:CDS:1, partial [Ambispora gerdemannii]